MRSPLGCVWWAAVIVIAAGCASAPEYRYFTLDMRPSGKVTAPVRMDTVDVKVSEALKRPEILIRTSPTQITYYALDRWASGLDQQVSEKFKTEFGNGPSDAPALWMDADLLAFEQVDTPSGAEVRVKLDVTAGWFNDGRRATDLRKTYERTAPASAAQPAAVVDALSRVVEEIALEVAQDPALQADKFRKSSAN